MKKNIIKLAFLIITASIIFIGCAKESAEDGGSDSGAVSFAADPETANDVYCLACHGGSYEEHIKRTEEKLISEGRYDIKNNPHFSVHGGYFHCSNCHLTDRDLDPVNNKCATCHVYPYIRTDR